MNALPSMPVIFLKILLLFAERHDKASVAMILNMIIVKIAFALTTIRIQYKEVGKLGFPNWYSLIFAVSGCEKDRICDELDELIFKNFYTWLDGKANDYYDVQVEEIKRLAATKFQGDKYEAKRQSYINDEIAKIRPLVPEVYNGTPEGIFEEAKVRYKANFGAIFIKMTEFSKYFLNLRSEDKLFFSFLLIAYGAKFPSKCTKGDKREKDIVRVPLNCMLMCDPSLFEPQKARQELLLELHTGFARRAMCSFVPEVKFNIDNDIQGTLAKEVKFFEEAEKINEEFIKIFMRIEANAIYDLLNEALMRLREYRNELSELANNTNNTLLKKEIKDRELKALKLATIFAPLNHQDKVINLEDMKQAISVVEFLSTDFKAFLNYKPKYSDKYDCAFEFFLEHLDTGFTKTQLIQEHFREFGVSRDKFKDEFDEYIAIVSNIAYSKGYLLHERPINRNSGKEFLLQKLNEITETNTEIIDLDKLVNIPANPANLVNANSDNDFKTDDAR